MFWSRMSKIVDLKWFEPTAWAGAMLDNGSPTAWVGTHHRRDINNWRVGSSHKHRGYGLNKECALVTELVLSGRVRANWSDDAETKRKIFIERTIYNMFNYISWNCKLLVNCIYLYIYVSLS